MRDRPVLRLGRLSSARYDRTASLVTSVPRRSRWNRPDSNHANGSLRSPFSPSNPCSSIAGAREGCSRQQVGSPGFEPEEDSLRSSSRVRIGRPNCFARHVRSSQKPMGSPGFEPGSTAPKAASMAKLTHDPASTPTPCRRENVSLRPIGSVQIRIKESRKPSARSTPGTRCAPRSHCSLRCLRRPGSSSVPRPFSPPGIG